MATMTDRKDFELGRGYWQQYVNLNGYSWKPSNSGLKKLSVNLDLNVPYLRKCINIFLEA